MLTCADLGALDAAMGGEKNVPETQLNAADTAWLLTATALVLFMTVPGLSIF
jgi:Amt family ammonium transporter